MTWARTMQSNLAFSTPVILELKHTSSKPFDNVCYRTKRPLADECGPSSYLCSKRAIHLCLMTESSSPSDSVTNSLYEDVKDKSSTEQPDTLQDPDPQSIEVLHMTDNWIAVNKPPGILMHRTKLYPSRRNERFLVTDVRDIVSKRLDRKVRVFPVHRLDRPTSGVVIFGLHEPRNAAMLQEALQNPTTQKQYWALAFGAHMPEEWVNEHPLKDSEGPNRKQRSARTEFERLASFTDADVSVVRATLASGRRHQIRRHLSNSRFPILGDTSHGDTKLNHAAADAYGVPRCCLHSRRLTFTDPFTSDRMYLQVSVPKDLRDTLKRISEYSSELDSQLDLDDPIQADRDSEGGDGHVAG